MKKVLLCIIVLILLCIDYGVVYADTSDELYNEIDNTLSNIDFSKIDDFLTDYGGIDISFQDEVYKILTGETTFDMANVFTFILSFMLSTIGKILPTAVILLVIGIMSSFLVGLSSSGGASEYGSLISTIAVILITIVSFKDVLSITKDVIGGVIDFISMLCPIMLTVFLSIGSSASTAVFATIFSVVSGVIHFIFDNILYPIMVIYYVLIICNTLSSHIRLDKMTGFVYGVFKFVVGITFTLFFGFLSLQSLTILKYDSISIKATRFAISSYIPLIGSFLSQGLDYVLMGGTLIKNAIGIVGIVTLVIMVFTKILGIFLLRLSYGFVSGILEFVGGDSVSGYLDRFSSLLVLPIVITIAVVFFYIILLMVLISTANIGVL